MLVNQTHSHMNIEAFVAIRLNSKRLKDKNILEIGGKPLCWHILARLLACPALGRVSVFCSTEQIMDYVPRGVNFVPRDQGLDGDEVRGLELFSAFAETVPSDYYLLAHATAPFTRVETVEMAVQKMQDPAYDSVFSAAKAHTYAWYRNEPINYEPSSMARTQEIHPILLENSGIYLYSRELMLKDHRRIGFRPYIIEVDMPESIDIDNKHDFDVAQRFADLL
jgi:CMP-N-acetylneuraminic acid synthetase